MGILKKVWAVITSVFSGLFAELKKMYKELPESQKLALKNGSGFMAFLNTVLDKSPDEVRAGLEHQFNFSAESVNRSVEGLCKFFNLPFINFEGGVKALQKFIIEQPDKASWSKIMNAGGSVVTTLLDPATPQQKITTLLEYTYQEFIKPMFVKK